MEYYSHISGNRKEKVEDHLELAAEYTSKYAEEIGCPHLGYILGYTHDTGKMTQKFQKVLNRQVEKINHAIPGASILYSEFSDLFKEYPYGKQIVFGLLKGHHAGLTAIFDEELLEKTEESVEGVRTDWNWVEDEKTNSLSSKEEYSRIVQFLKRKKFKQPEDLSFLSNSTEDEKMMFIRLLFSCLVDGDYTATGLFEENRERYESPKSKSWNELIALLNNYRSQFESKKHMPINKLRNSVYEQATRAGKNADFNVYSMTAPTGTAKTLAMLSFALECAKKNGQNRIFIVLPYLSIIDQTVKVCKEIFGEDLVLEDDSTSDYVADDSQEASLLRLFAEKWDMQIIITTNVKFYETLFSSKPKTLRKLHSVANSVLLFDESQTLPSDVTDISMNALNTLTKYKTTILLSTATPPEFGLRVGIRKPPKEIIENVRSLYEIYDAIHALKTVFMDKKVDYKGLADLPHKENQVLYVFNTTSKAKKMYDELKKRNMVSVFILYSNMCKAHRKKTIDIVKKRLQEGKPCLLVSTQCIEAGVDIDFHMVCREYAPYPSLVQTFGRCNRNGSGSGIAYVFLLDDNDSFGYPDERYRTESRITQRMAEKKNFNVNLSDLSILKEYYKSVFAGDGPESSDKPSLCEAVADMNFVKTDEEYKIIEDKNTVSIIVPYDDEEGTYEKILEALEENGFLVTKSIMAQTHSITVNLFVSKKTRLVLAGCQRLCVMHKGVRYETNWFIMTRKESYDNEYGIKKEEGGGIFA